MPLAKSASGINVELRDNKQNEHSVREICIPEKNKKKQVLHNLEGGKCVIVSSTSPINLRAFDSLVVRRMTRKPCVCRKHTREQIGQLENKTGRSERRCRRRPGGAAQSSFQSANGGDGAGVKTPRLIVINRRGGNHLGNRIFCPSCLQPAAKNKTMAMRRRHDLAGGWGQKPERKAPVLFVTSPTGLVSPQPRYCFSFFVFFFR